MRTVTLEVVQTLAEEARELVFQAEAIVSLTRSAVIGETPSFDNPVLKWDVHRALTTVCDMLNQVETALDPANIDRLTKVKKRVDEGVTS